MHLNYVIDVIDLQVMHILDGLRKKQLDYHTSPGALLPMSGGFPDATPLQPENITFLMGTPDTQLVNSITRLTDRINVCREVAFSLNHEIEAFHQWLIDHSDQSQAEVNRGMAHFVSLEKSAGYLAKAARIIDLMGHLEKETKPLVEQSKELASDFLSVAKRRFPIEFEGIAFGSPPKKH